MADLFTADCHFGHAKILGFCSRPFVDVRAMNAALVSNWNQRVRPTDHVYVLGDFALPSNYRHVALWLSQLKGEKTLVTGNHDKRNAEKLREAGFSAVHYGNPEHGGVPYRDAVLCHQPPSSAQWETMQAEGAQWVFHGHVHTYWKRRGPFVNVGVDVQGFSPKTYGELIAP